VATVMAAVAVAGALVFAACGSESKSERSDRETGTTATTRAPATTVTTVAPQTVPVPPAQPPAITVPPPAITVPPGSPRTTPATTAPATTTSPTVTAAPEPTTTTTRPARAQRTTVVYSPPDAPKWRGDLVLPRQHGDTIVVLVHTENGGRKQMRGWANFYAQHGYPSFAIDYTRPALPPTYPKPQTDLKAAVQYLRGRAAALGIAPDRIVVQGFETGAALGAQAEVTPDDPFFAGPRHYPDQSDKPAAFIGFYGLYDGTHKDPSIYYGGPSDSADPKVQERYAKANSIAQAANAAGPALLVQGDADAPEFVESATRFRDALQNAGKDVTLTVVPGAHSAFDQETSGALTPEGKQAGQQVLDWLTARFPPQ
jgi:acetyl esterase/lipase